MNDINFSFNQDKVEMPEQVDAEKYPTLTRYSPNGAVDYLGMKLALNTNLTAKLTVE
jgi:hypothetical protein